MQIIVLFLEYFSDYLSKVIPVSIFPVSCFFFCIFGTFYRQSCNTQDTFAIFIISRILHDLNEYYMIFFLKIEVLTDIILKFSCLFQCKCENSKA